MRILKDIIEALVFMASLAAVFVVLTMVEALVS